MAELKEGVKIFLEDILFWDFVALLPRAIVRLVKGIGGILAFIGGINIIITAISSVVVMIATMVVFFLGLNSLSNAGAFFTIQAIEYAECIFGNIYGVMLFGLSVAAFVLWWNMRKAALAKAATAKLFTKS
ncbi:MAG: hypothetical protein WC863_00715 [Patescibacteria group bacterium]